MESSATPKISVVIPCYNSVRFIEETLRSILDQDYPAKEIIVVDGGSSDSTLDILRKYGDKIKWISENDAGQLGGLFLNVLTLARLLSTHAFG